jgi:hypothetical protein
MVTPSPKQIFVRRKTMKSDRIHLTASPIEPPVSVSFLYKTAAEKHLLSPIAHYFIDAPTLGK